MRRTVDRPQPRDRVWDRAWDRAWHRDRARHRGRVWGRRGACAAALSTCGVGALVAGAGLWVRACAAGRMYDVASAPARDVALVLGAGLRANGTPTPYLAARLDLARDLYARGAVTSILVSGDNRTQAYDEPSAMRRYLLDAGIPAERIVADFAGLDTYDSCYRARAVFGVRSVIVVSQTYHVPRALALCCALGLDAVGVGDESGRASAATWAAGEQREILAAVKAVWDVVSQRSPVVGSLQPTVG